MIVDKVRLTQTILEAQSSGHKLANKPLERARASDHTAAIIGLALQNAASPAKDVRRAALTLLLECEQYLKPTGKFQGKHILRYCSFPWRTHSRDPIGPM